MFSRCAVRLDGDGPGVVCQCPPWTGQSLPVLSQVTQVSRPAMLYPPASPQHSLHLTSTRAHRSHLSALVPPRCFTGGKTTRAMIRTVSPKTMKIDLRRSTQ